MQNLLMKVNADSRGVVMNDFILYTRSTYLLVCLLIYSTRNSKYVLDIWISYSFQRKKTFCCSFAYIFTKFASA